MIGAIKMKTKLIKRVPGLAAVLAFLALSAGNAFAIENSSRVVSPYWQSDTTSYTFMSVTHPSLSGMSSAIGVRINVIQNDTSAFAAAKEFTISSGTTQKVFITRTGHPVNPTSVPDAIFLSGTTNFKHGHIRIDPVASHPTRSAPHTQANRYIVGGFRDVTMLSFWGAVVVEQNTTGFAMEFIGDMNDSAATEDFHNTMAVHGPAAP